MKAHLLSASVVAWAFCQPLYAGGEAQVSHPTPAVARPQHRTPVGLKHIPSVTLGHDSQHVRRFASLAQDAQSDAPTLYGIICDRNGDWTVSSFQAAPGITLHEEFKHEDLYASGGAVYAQGKLYVNYYYEKSYLPYIDQFIFDTNPWALRETRNLVYDLPTANVMAYDKVTAQIYLQQPVDDEATSGWLLGTMNFTSGELQPIRYMSDDEGIVAMAFDENGVLYGVNFNGMFEIIDTRTGKVSKIGHTDVRPGETMQSAIIDPATGKFYWAAFTDEDKSELYEVDLTTGHATFISKFPVSGSLPCLYVPDAEISANAPAAATDLHFAFDGPALLGQFVFTVPSVSQSGAALTTGCSAHVTVAGSVHDLTVEPGQTYSVPASVQAEGYAAASVTLRNAAGVSEVAQCEKWLGPDYPAVPTDILLEPIDGTTQVLLTWSAPTTGTHGGYVNPAEMTYFIYGNEPSSAIGGTSWIEHHPDTFFIKDVAGINQTIHYQIRPSYMGKNGTIGMSNDLYVGGGLVAPCTINYNNSETFANCTVIDANGDGKTWSPYMLGYLLNTSNPADDWVITPGIYMKAGHRYNVTVRYGTRNGVMSPFKGEFTMGSAPTVEAQSKLADMSCTTINAVKTETQLVSIEESGEYYFGVHDFSTSTWENRLYWLEVEEEAAFVAPNKIAGLTITSAEQGELKATLEFVAPTHDVSGNPLTSIDQIEIKRAKTVIAYLENITPGQTCTYVDESARQGNNTYTLAAINAEGGRGAEVSGTVYCGVDVPGLVSNVVLSTEGNLVRMTWDAPTTGLNGGYIRVEDLEYLILDPYYGNEQDMVKGQTFIEWTYDNEAPGQQSLEFAVAARNVAGMSEDAVVSNTIVIGHPYDLPFCESFDYGMGWHAWFTTGRADWNFSKGTDSDKAGYCRFYASSASDARLVSGMINVKDAQDPHLNVLVYGNGTQDSLVVEVIDDFNSLDYKRLAAFCMDTLPSQQWSRIDVSLADFTQLPYIHVILHAYGTKSKASILVDDIQVLDVQGRDLAAGQFTLSQENVVAGQDTVTASLTVLNRGSLPVAAGDYQVDFYAGERLYASVPGVALGYFEEQVVEASYVATVKDPSPVMLYAVVNYAQDVLSYDNTSEEVEVFVTQLYRPAVTDLAGTVEGKDIRLTWTEPNLTTQPATVVTDDFESYRPFQINDFGEWTLVDVDQCPVVTTSWLFYPDQYLPMAFDIFNTQQIKYHDQTLDAKWPAHSGKQFAMCMGAAFVDNDDWMITPELSGHAQTVSFWANSVDEEEGHEMIRLYYSTTGTALSDFIELTDDILYVPSHWTEYSQEVPAGAKYFAVRCVSHNRMALQIDDFTYEQCEKPVQVQLIGYNVYGNGELLNDSPVVATSFVTEFDAATDYYVCAVYDFGESLESNIVRGTAVGIEAVPAPVKSVQHYDLYGRRLPHIRTGQLFITK